MANNKTIQAFFEEYAHRFPNHIAAENELQKLTYGGLNQRANQLAHYLQKLGVHADTPVALCLERSFDFLITLIAILKAGGAYLPMDYSQPQERLLLLLNHSKAPIVITKSVFKDKLISFQGTLLLLDSSEENINACATDLPPSRNTSTHLAYIIYTSGSTGTPKGVLIEHRSVVNYCLWFAEYTLCAHQQRVDCSANPIFDMSITTTIVPLMLGLTVVLCNELTKKDVRHYLQHLAQSQVNIIKLTPSYLKVLLQETKNNFIPLPQLQSLILGGENLSAAECQSWLSLYREHCLFNEYGPTEATVAVSAYKVNSHNCAHLETNVPIGTLGTHMSCIILDNNNHTVPDGELGELFIGGLCLARGYLNQPELTRQRFITKNNLRLYKTGDLCKKSPDGIIEFYGRIDEQVKIRGYRIEPRGIEELLNNHPDLKEVAIVSQKDSFDEYRLVVYYMLKNLDAALNANQIRQYLQKHLPAYMIPTVFVKVDFFPLTANGKLDKSALPVPLLANSHNYVEPTTALEKKLAQIWSEELGIPLIGIHDDFFDLGGHSLSAARIVSKIENQLSRSISLDDFYKATHIEKLAPVIKKTKKNKIKTSSNSTSTPDYHKLAKIPLSDFQFLLWMSNTFAPKAQRLNIVARKRVQGRLNKDALDFAFQALLKKHEALIYRILKLQPAQKIKKKWLFKLAVHHLESLSIPNSEHELNQSMTQLINFYPWPKNTPLIMGKLFYLQNEESEIHICMPHLISDDYCADIVFSELSRFYQEYNHVPLDTIEKDSHFKDRIFNERHAMNAHLDRDSSFWEDYLKDASLFAFPKEHVVSNMTAENVPYSTYSVLPEEALNQLKLYCERNHISINNALCAAIGLALRNCCGTSHSESTYTFINMIQSTRDNLIYDHTVGCFLRVEPTKILLDDAATLIGLSQQIRQSIIETSSYQNCSSFVKLCAVGSLKSNTVERLLVPLITPFYTKILKIPAIYRKILQRCGSRMISFKRKSQFVININIRDDFSHKQPNNSELFGLKTTRIKTQMNDLLAIDTIFEACFVRDENQNTHYLVLSANLKPEFRALIAKEVLRIISSVPCEKSIQETHTSSEKMEPLM